MSKRNATTRMILAAATAAAAMATAGYGQARIYDGGIDADNKWSTPNNWNTDTAPPVAGVPAEGWRLGSSATELVTDMDQSYSFGQLQFLTNSGYVINSSTAGTMSLASFNTGQIITMPATAGFTATVNVPILLTSLNTTNVAGEANRRTINTDAASLTINGAINANADALRNFSVRKIGSGSLTLGAANAIAAGFEATNGNVFLGNDGSLGTGAVTVANGATNTVRYASSSTAARAIGNNFTTTGAGVLAFGDATNNGAIALGGTFTLNDTVNAKPIAVIAGNTVTAAGGWTGPGGWLKNNPGTLVLNGSNNYAGLTTVGAGTLRLNGTITGAATAGGGVLEGTGTVGGQLIVNDVDLADANLGGAVAPGTAGTVGTLNASGNASFGAGGRYLFDVNGVVADTLILGGALTASATAANPFAIFVGGVSPLANTQLTLVDGATAVGGFDPAKFTVTSAAAGGGTYAIGTSADGTNLVLNYTVPEPATLAAFALAGVALRRRRR